MNGKNPNYRPNALSRLYLTIFAGAGKAWTTLGWMPRNYVKVLGVIFLVLSPFWLWLIYKIWGEIGTLTGDTVPKATSDDLRNIAYALGVTITALAGLLAAPLILIRTWVSERHANTAEQGLITDRFTKAVEQLGTEKTVKYRSRTVTYIIPAGGQPDRQMKFTLREGHEPDIPDGAVDIQASDWETLDETTPNLEVRLGAIYALERIAQDSERDHIPIMETLCAYIRENAPGGGAKDHGLGDWPDWIDDADYEAHAVRKTAG